MPADATLCRGFYFHRSRWRCAKCRLVADVSTDDVHVQVHCPGCRRSTVLSVSRETSPMRTYPHVREVPAKALTVFQPYATLLVMGLKAVENRGWPTKFRGRLAIHAGKQMQIQDYVSARDYLRSISPAAAEWLPAFIDLPRGAVVGSVELHECRRSPDRMADLAAFETPDGFSWHCRLPLQHGPIPWRGAQGIWPIKSALGDRIGEKVRSL